MDIEYSSTRKEVWDFYWRNWLNGNAKWVHARISLGLFLLVIFNEYISNTLQLQSYIKAALVSCSVIILMILIPQLMFKQDKRFLSINSDGIDTKIGKHSKLIQWKEISSIEKNNNFIYVLGNKGHGLVIPFRAFKNNEEQNSFFESATFFYNEANNA